MVRLQLIVRSFLNGNKTVQTSFYLPQRLYGSKSNKDKDNKAEQEKSDSTPKKGDQALSKLNTLLQQMVTDDASRTKLNLAKPKNRREIRKEPGTKLVKSETVEKKIVTAVKDVAEVIGGNTKQTESELLSKLLNGGVKAEESEAAQNGSMSLSDIVKGMKIDRETKAPEAISRAHHVRQLLQQNNQKTQAAQHTDNRAPRQRRVPRVQEREAGEIETVDVFGSPRLGIFTNELEDKSGEMNKTWNMLKQRELRLAVTHPPMNYFQEMILWTQQGKIWKFPIDNEQDMIDEHDIYFTEHVFLEEHLEPWCPKKGPVRHFMELVTVGLSKNPYMSVKEKRDHLEWYKNYFAEKMQLLKDVGAIPADVTASKAPKEVEAK